MTQRERSRKARQEWQRLVAEQGRSGQSVAAFCRGRGLVRSRFFWWRKRLRAAGPEARQTPLTKFLEVKLTPAVPEQMGAGPAWKSEDLARAVADRPQADDGRVEVVLRNGRRLWVGSGFDAGQVRVLAAVLESEA